MNDNQQNSQSSPENKDDGSARVRLLEAATKLFAEHGLEGTSIREIAKATDLNISLISYYFGGKEGLYKAVIYEFANQMANKVEALMQPMDLQNLTRDSFKEIMRAFIKNMLPAKMASREINTILQREMMAGLPHAKEVYENVFSRILEKVIGIYKAGQAKGFVRQDLNPYIIFLSMVHSTDIYIQMSQCHTRMEDKILKLPEQMDLYTDQIYRIFVEGILV